MITCSATARPVSIPAHSLTFCMRFIEPVKLLAINSVVCILLSAVVIFGTGLITIYSILVIILFMSIMFPTIFALGLKDLGPLTKKGASFLVMAVAGGAFCPPVMGAIGDHYGMPVAFTIPLFCFAFIGWYGIRRSSKAEKSS